MQLNIIYFLADVVNQELSDQMLLKLAFGFGWSESRQSIRCFLCDTLVKCTSDDMQEHAKMKHDGFSRR